MIPIIPSLSLSLSLRWLVDTGENESASLEVENKKGDIVLGRLFGVCCVTQDYEA